MSLNPKDKRYLKSQAHHLEPVVMVGQNGLSETLIDEVAKQLKEHELIKVRFNSHKDEKNSFSAEIATNTNSELIAVVGNVAILYREHEEKKKRKFTLSNPEKSQSL